VSTRRKLTPSEVASAILAIPERADMPPGYPTVRNGGVEVEWAWHRRRLRVRHDCTGTWVSTVERGCATTTLPASPAHVGVRGYRLDLVSLVREGSRWLIEGEMREGPG
jgi:hypothetical protein